MPDTRPVVTRRAAEIGFAIFTAALGAVVIYGARDLDTGWSDTGPEAGYFPYRLGIIIFVASLVNLARAILRPGAPYPFLNVSAMKGLARFALPLIALIAATPVLGVYISAALYLFVTIAVVAREPLRRALSVAVLLPVALFVLFEFAFKTPLPKGPLGPLFGML
ncbi:MAG TPA: tripartite tricarboxylate transporter TctB family protein [Hyphomicrobiaceae bacterium]|nr:tripartite tricarboxylate transporter TctB family protein [Hyphomicrobiaceae bacterium]